MIKAVILAASATIALGQMDDVLVDNDFLSQDMIRAPFESEDFLIKYDTPPIAGPGGTITLRGLDSTPIIGAVRDGGVSTGTYELLPCGVINPHSHPGSGENIYNIEGTLEIGFVGAGRVLMEDVGPGESFQVPQGLVHWLENMSCDTVSTGFLALPSPDPGLVLAAPALFSTPDSVLYATFPTLSMEDIMAAKAAALGAGIPELNPACVARCAAMGDGSYGDDGEWMVAGDSM